MDQYIRSWEMTINSNDFKTDIKPFKSTKLNDLPYGFRTTEKVNPSNIGFESEITWKLR